MKTIYEHEASYNEAVQVWKAAWDDCTMEASFVKYAEEGYQRASQLRNEAEVKMKKAWDKVQEAKGLA